MRRIALQAGHQNARNNCEVALRGGTGAPGEAEFTVRVRDRLAAILIGKGFQVFLSDATANCQRQYRTEDFDLFLAIHYDAHIYGTGGGFVDAPDPSVDAATQESNRIRRAIAGEYFPHTGIKEVTGRSNANTRLYYMWRVLTARTPCAIIECGVGQEPHDKVILADTERVASAIARGICKAFGVAYDAPKPTPPPPTPQPDFRTLYEQSQNEVRRLADALKAADERGKRATDALARVKAILSEAGV